MELSTHASRRGRLRYQGWHAMALVLASPAFALAQCAMCKANIAHAENAAATAQKVNAAILVLLLPTLAIIGGIIRLVFSYRNFQNNAYDKFRPTGSECDSQ